MQTLLTPSPVTSPVCGPCSRCKRFAFGRPIAWGVVTRDERKSRPSALPSRYETIGQPIAGAIWALQFDLPLVSRSKNVRASCRRVDRDLPWTCRHWLPARPARARPSCRAETPAAIQASWAFAWCSPASFLRRFSIQPDLFIRSINLASRPASAVLRAGSGPYSHLARPRTPISRDRRKPSPCAAPARCGRAP